MSLDEPDTGRTETFQSIGLDFPLFHGPIAHACCDAVGPCTSCGRVAAMRFEGGCFRCFRSGLIDCTRDTELGMVRAEDARAGMTHGIPMDGPEHDEYELVAHPFDPLESENWYSVRIESEYLWELLRTPNYHSWQGECWQFCCKRPSTFLGIVPSTVLGDLVDTESAISNWLAEPNWALAEEVPSGVLSYCAFRCVTCGRIKYHENTS